MLSRGVVLIDSLLQSGMTRQREGGLTKNEEKEVPELRRWHLERGIGAWGAPDQIRTFFSVKRIA
jgi:hypothetical protein